MGAEASDSLNATPGRHSAVAPGFRLVYPFGGGFPPSNHLRTSELPSPHHIMAAKPDDKSKSKTKIKDLKPKGKVSGGGYQSSPTSSPRSSPSPSPW